MRGYEKFAMNVQKTTENRLIMEFLEDLEYDWSKETLRKKWEKRLKE